MPDEPITTPSEGGDSPAPAAAPAVEPKGTPAPERPQTKATVQNRPQRSSDAFDAILEETKAELAVKDEPAPKADEPDDEDADEDEDDKSAPPKKDEPKKDDEPEGDEPKGDAPDDGEPADEKTVAEQILELMKNPEMLERALRQAGVDTIQELPFVKDIVGRSTQSAIDAAKAAAAKEAFEEKQVNQVLEKGRKAATEVVDLVEKLSKDLEDGAEDFKVPTTEYLVEKFNEYADGAVHAYHNKNFGEIAETVYNYPEMKGLPEEQQAFLASFAGKPPAQWLEAHLEVQRQNLWAMAQNDVRLKAEQIIEDRTKSLEEAHRLDIAKLNEKHEKAIVKAVDKAKAETRAEQLAEIASKGAPPRVPNKDNRPAVDEDEITGTSFEDIFASVKRSMEKSRGV